MSSRILLTLWFLMVSTLCQAVEVSSGTLKKLEPFGSELFPQKNVFIWLPEGYSTAKKYAVLYMHDAQNLFDVDTSSIIYFPSQRSLRDISSRRANERILVVL